MVSSCVKLLCLLSVLSTVTVAQDCVDVANCQTCYLSNCYLCSEGYYLDLDSQCQACYSNCLSCNNRLSCNTCQKGFYLQPSLNPMTIDDPESSCTKCQTGCSSCTSKDFCEKCQDGYYLNLQYEYSSLINKTCQSCPQYCTSCTITDSEPLETGKVSCSGCVDRSKLTIDGLCSKPPVSLGRLFFILAASGWGFFTLLTFLVICHKRIQLSRDQSSHGATQVTVIHM